MEKKKLIEIINDMLADNDFNTDEDAKHDINISVHKLISGFGITDEELQEDLDGR